MAFSRVTLYSCASCFSCSLVSSTASFRFVSFKAAFSSCIWTTFLWIMRSLNDFDGLSFLPLMRPIIFFFFGDDEIFRILLRRTNPSSLLFSSVPLIFSRVPSKVKALTIDRDSSDWSSFTGIRSKSSASSSALLHPLKLSFTTTQLDVFSSIFFGLTLLLFGVCEALNTVSRTLEYLEGLVVDNCETCCKDSKSGESLDLPLLIRLQF
mmetsp:Transcript_23903/g.36394  ORF Transcript_23903/g.36394 Transcript_23903/m.36394 type:complete len:209 (+) Transcript_23903:1091-1717(+)